jgi:hypothetical protein
VSKPGSHQHAKAVAAAAAADAGLTRLEIQLVAHIASRGTDWQTDEQLRGELTKPNGLRYHRESIGRVRRQLTRGGVLNARRIMPGQSLPAGARFGRSSHGCVIKSIAWAGLRVATVPTARGARSADRAVARKLRREQQRPMSPAETAQSARAVLEMLDGIGSPPRRAPRPPDTP